jgi:two-component system OmpR family sensor kinase
MNPRRSTLTRALIGRQMLILVAMLLALGTTQIVVLRHVLISSTVDSLHDELSVLRPVLHHALKTDPTFPALVPVLFKRFKAPGVVVLLANHSGFIIANSPHPDVATNTPPPLPAPDDFTIWSHHIVVGSVINDAQYGNLGTIWLMSSLAPTNAILWQDARLYGLLALAVLIAAGLFGSLSLQRSLVPLEQVTETTERIAAGDFGRQAVVGPAPAEIARLGDAVNRMSGAVEAALAAERQAQAEVRRFVADASHELRTPLTALSGFLDLWAAGNLDPEEAETSLAAMRRETSRMTRLVQQLLRLSHLDQEGTSALHPAVLPLESLLADLQPTLQALLPGRLALSVEPSPIWADRDRFSEVMLNLVDNAARYGRGQVTLTAGPGPQGARVVVEDEGPGLPPDSVQHLFERFYRADRSRSRAAGGAGLGLSIVESLVRAHGGDIHADNGPRGGARFTIDWPTADPHSVQTPPASGSTPAAEPPAEAGER